MTSRYTALDRSGQVDKLAALHDLAQVQAISQDDIRTAIDELKRSTDSISKQTETLRQQREALARLVSRSVGNDTRRQDLEASRKRSADSEQKRLAAEVGLSFLSAAVAVGRGCTDVAWRVLGGGAVT